MKNLRGHQTIVFLFLSVILGLRCSLITPALITLNSANNNRIGKLIIFNIVVFQMLQCPSKKHGFLKLDTCNNLPKNVVNAPSVNMFKNRLDKHWHMQPSKFKAACYQSGQSPRGIRTQY